MYPTSNSVEHLMYMYINFWKHNHSDVVFFRFVNSMPREPYIVSVQRKIKTKHHFELDQFSSAETKARYSSFITSVEIYCNNSFYEYYGSSLSRIYEESDPDKSCSPRLC